MARLLAILADIHGNLPALDAVLADLAPFGVDQVIVAGDVINWGPFSAQVMARVVEGGWAAIRGNNEFYLTDFETPRAPVEWNNSAGWPLLPWLKRQMAGRWTTVVAGWPDSLNLRFPDAPAIRVVHGSPRGNAEPIFPGSPVAEVVEMLADVQETTVIAAHTHLPVDRHVPGRPDGGAWRVLNPGSVGVPLDGCFVSRYLLLEGTAAGWTATPREVPLDPAPVLAEFERQDFEAVCGIVGYFVVQEFRNARLELPTFLNWRRAMCPDRPLTRALLADYARVNPLDYVHKAYRAGWTSSRASGQPPAVFSALP